MSADRTAYFALMHRRPDLFDNDGAGVTIVRDPDGIAAIERIMGDRLDARGLPRDWASIGLLHRDQYFTLLRDAVRFPDGSPGTHFRIVRPEVGEASGAALLPLHQGRILLLRHYRHATRRWHLEIPRGGIDAGQSAEQTAVRELWEEMQGTVGAVVPLGPVFGSTAYVGQPVHLFMGEVVEFGGPALGEGIAEIVPLSVPEFEERLKSGAIDDSFTIAAFCHARLRGLL